MPVKRKAPAASVDVVHPQKQTIYGKIFPANFCKVDIEGYAFKNRIPSEKGGLGTFRHFKNFSKLLYPDLEWHDWADLQIQSLCENNFVAWTGCATAAKTFGAAHFAMCWWAVDPGNTTVVLTSTTGSMVRKRIWPVIQHLFHNCKRIPESPLFCKGIPGILVDSKTTLHAMKVDALGKVFKDDKHGIFAKYVRQGATGKAVADIQGIHSPRMMIVVDEATDTPEAILEAITNLRKGCNEFILLVIGNPVSHLDPHGMCCTPKAGWNSINIDSDDWETKGVPQWDIDPGVCLKFDGTKSPNVKAGFKKYHYLFSIEDGERAARAGTDTVGYWKFARGFWPPEGICRTIFSENMVERNGGTGKHVFLSRKTVLASLDPGFGGDECVLRFGVLGDIEGGHLGLTITEKIPISFKADSDKEIEYQIASRVMDECKRRGCLPENFGMDSTGTGRGAAAVLATEWSSSIIKVEFGGSPSDKPAALDDPRPSTEVYDRRVTELWYSCREMLSAGQLKGLTTEDVQEFCSREYSIPGKKYVLDTKDECRKKIGRSPDNADSVAVMVEVARRLGAVPQHNVSRQSDFLTVAQKYDAVYGGDQHEQTESEQMTPYWGES